MTEYKVVELVKEWKDEMKAVVADYNTMLQKLDVAVTLAQESEKKFFVVHKTSIAIGLTLLFASLFLIVIFSAMRLSDTCFVTVSEKETAFAVKSCKDISQRD